jgi:hypothetical protein
MNLRENCGSVAIWCAAISYDRYIVNTAKGKESFKKKEKGKKTLI